MRSRGFAALKAGETVRKVRSQGFAAFKAGEADGVKPRFAANLLGAEAQKQKPPARASVGRNAMKPSLMHCQRLSVEQLGGTPPTLSRFLALRNSTRCSS